MKELPFIVIGGVLFLAATGFDSYNTEQQTNWEDSATVQRDHTSLPERLGYAILTRAGYATVELPEENGIDQGQPLRIVWHSEHPDFRCVDGMAKMESEDRAKADPFMLLMATVAAEKYNRPAFLRNSEELVARAALTLSGSLPDFSLGVAQVRPSIVRTGVQEAIGEVKLSDRELLDLTLDDCTNVAAADRYLRRLLREADQGQDKYAVVDAVARRYVGALSTGENGAMYQMAVGGAYRLLEVAAHGYWGGEGDEMPSPGFLGCILFPVGEPTGRLSDDIRGVLAGAQTVTLGFADHEPGPADYRARLSEMRQNWMLQQMSEAGVPAEAVTIAAPTDKLCSGSSLSNASVIMSPPPEGSGEGDMAAPEN